MTKLQEFDPFNKTYRSDIDKAVAFSGQDHEFFTRVKADYLVELLSDLHTRDTSVAPLKVLDVGCGHGHIHPHLLKSGVPLALSGIDMASTVIEEAKQTNPSVDYTSYDGEMLPYADASFDAAYAIAVMHHVPPAQWAAFLAEMKRVVRPGGLIAIFEHNPLNPLTRWIVNTCPIDENAVLLGMGKLKGLVAGTGFGDISGRYILFLPFDGKTFRDFDKTIGWLPLGAQYYVAARRP